MMLVTFITPVKESILMEVLKAHFSKRWQKIEIAVVAALGEFGTTDLWLKTSACSQYSITTYVSVHLVYGMNVFKNFVVSSERFQLMEVQKAHFSKRWQKIEIAVVDDPLKIFTFTFFS